MELPFCGNSFFIILFCLSNAANFVLELGCVPSLTKIKKQSRKIAKFIN